MRCTELDEYISEQHEFAHQDICDRIEALVLTEPPRLTTDTRQISPGFNALATDLADSAVIVAAFDVDSAFVVGAFDVEIDVREHLLGAIGTGRDGLATFFRERNRLTDRVKSLHPPLSTIPASLHPADLAA